MYIYICIYLYIDIDIDRYKPEIIGGRYRRGDRRAGLLGPIRPLLEGNVYLYLSIYIDIDIDG